MAQPKSTAPVAVALVAHAAITALTWRDLRRRPAALVRGSKKLWRIVATLNTLGSVAYVLFGRRRGPAS